MTEQQYWDNVMKHIRLNNRVLLHKNNGEQFIPVYDESEPPFTFAVITDGNKKRLSVF